jgi:hypothetical protein
MMSWISVILTFCFISVGLMLDGSSDPASDPTVLSAAKAQARPEVQTIQHAYQPIAEHMGKAVSFMSTVKLVGHRTVARRDERRAVPS